MARGSLRIYLGAAPGVGKTYAMLNEGCRRRTAAPTSSSASSRRTARVTDREQLGDLEIVPRRACRLPRRGDRGDGCRRRSSPGGPRSCSSTSTPTPTRPAPQREALAGRRGAARRRHRRHLDAQHPAPRVAERRRRRGSRASTQRETVPDAIVRRADQIELVDMTPEALRRRMAHGNIYPAERIDAALEQLLPARATSAPCASWRCCGSPTGSRTRCPTTSRSRHHRGVGDARARRRRHHRRAERRPAHPPRRTDGRPRRRRPDRRARRHRRRSVRATSDATRSTTSASSSRELGGTVHEVVGHRTADALVGFARAEKATQLVLGAIAAKSVVRDAGTVRSSPREPAGRRIDVHVIATERDGRRRGARPRPAPADRAAPRSRLRGCSQSWACRCSPPSQSPLRDDLALSTVLLVFLAVVVGVERLGGRLVGGGRGGRGRRCS